jgi:hypothetical protein
MPDELSERPLEEYTLSDLKEIAAAEGISGLETFDRKSQVISILTNVRMARKGDESVITPAKLSPKEEATDEKKWRADAQKMRDILHAQPKVRVMIPLEIGERKGSYHTVIINGYRMDIMKGVFVDVPEQVGKMIEESFELTARAGEELLLERVDPLTGRPMSETLKEY